MILLSMMILNLNRKQILWKYVCELLKDSLVSVYDDLEFKHGNKIFGNVFVNYSKILLSLTMTMKVFGIVVTFESKENVVKISNLNDK